MRIVYGAGAVAAMSVMAVGLVQPDFAATADQPATADQSAPADQAAAGQAAVGRTATAAQVRHVVRYIQLKPGQRAPAGATVIAAPGVAQPVTRPQANNVQQTRPAARPAPRPAAQPAAPQPQPQPKPRVNTRQSGKPR